MFSFIKAYSKLIMLLAFDCEWTDEGIEIMVGQGERRSACV
jgi:hypothetical protein